MPSPRLVKVTWIDIVRSGDAWSTHEDLKEIKPAECRSVGWLVKEEDDFIVLATHIGTDWKDEDMGILTAIPMCVISCVQDVAPLPAIPCNLKRPKDQ